VSDIRGSIRGDIGGVPHESEGDQHAVDDAHTRGDEPGSGFDIGEHTESHTAQHQSGPTHQHDVQTPPARTADGSRVLNFFRRGGTDLALMSKEVMEAVSRERVMNITVREAIRTRGEEAECVIMKELSQMITKQVWTPIDGRKLTAGERARIIRSSMFLKEKYLASGEFEKLRARLVAGRNQ
jgi:hypothetical protein